MRTRDYIDRIRKLTPTGSDYAVAKLLGISEDAINGYRLGRRAMCPDVALIIAEKLKLPILEVLADAQLEHAKDAATRARWANVRKTLSQRAAAVLMLIGAAVTSQPGDAVIVGLMSDTDSASMPRDNMLTIMRHIRRHVLSTWRALSRPCRLLPHPLR